MRKIRSLLIVCLLLGAGCKPSSTSLPPPPPVERPETRSPVTLKILVIDDPQLATAITRQVQPETRDVLEVTDVEPNALEQQQDQPPEADVVIFPCEWLGTLAEWQWIAPVPASVTRRESLAWMDVLPIGRQHESRWGADLYGLPLGSAYLQVVYRPDVLDDAQLPLPTTWDEFGDLAQKVRGLENQPDGAWLVAEPLAEGWRGKVLLARAAAYARQKSRYSTWFDFQSLEPLVDQPPFVRALEELVALHAEQADEALSWTPDDCRRLVLEGKAALAITWPSAQQAGGPHEPVAVPLGVTPLPGSTQVYSTAQNAWESRPANDQLVPLLAVAGRLVGVGRRTAHPAEAWDLAVALCGPDLARRLSPRSWATAPARQSQLDDIALWCPPGSPPNLLQQYAELLRQENQRSSYLASLRVPYFWRYMEALDRAVAQALRGERAPAEALAEAAAAWDEITKEIGVDRQREAYRRSLGLEM